MGAGYILSSMEEWPTSVAWFLEDDRYHVEEMVLLAFD